MKIYQEKEKRDYIITKSDGKKVYITLTDYLYLGKNISLYGNNNSEFREYAQARFHNRSVYKAWPKVSGIEYDEDNECFLFRDLIEIYDEYSDEDVPFTMEIYFYVDFDGNIISDAYSPIANKYFPLDLKPRTIPCVGTISDFSDLYKERIEQIGWEIIFLNEKRKRRAKNKLLCQKNKNL